MDVVMLSRLQFAVTVFFHFIFVPLTLGLVVLLAIMETLYVRTGNEVYKRMVKFWGKLFLINFVLGVVTGITLEFQFGTNWSRYSEYVGDIFGSLLAIEATAAFFLESTFLAVWAFGWERVSKKVHLTAIWLVAIASNLSALWIILANGWMQNPVGYVIKNDRAELSSFFDVVTNPFAWSQYFHTIFAAWMLGGFFVLGVSSWHLLRKNELDLFKRSVRIAAPFTLILVLLLGLQGHHHAQIVAEMQPAKLAAMESHWETGTHVPMYLLTWPDQANRTNSIQALPIPSLLSLLAFNSPSAEVKGLDAFPADDIPPVLPTFLSFRFMVACAGLFVLLAIAAIWFLVSRNPVVTTFVIPGICLVALVFDGVLLAVFRGTFVSGYAKYLLFDVGLGLIPLALQALGLTTWDVPSLVSALTASVFLLGLVVFARKQLTAEIRKLFSA